MTKRNKAFKEALKYLKEYNKELKKEYKNIIKKKAIKELDILFSVKINK